MFSQRVRGTCRYFWQSIITHYETFTHSVAKCRGVLTDTSPFVCFADISPTLWGNLLLGGLRFLRKPRVYGIYFACILAHISVSVCSNLRFEQRLSGAVFGTALLRLRVFFFFGAGFGTVIRTYRAHQEHRLHSEPAVLRSARV